MKYLTTLFVLVVVLAPFTASAYSNKCECVRFLREEMGVNIKGDARTIFPNASMWNVNYGDVLLLRYGKVSHAAQVIGFTWVEGRQEPLTMRVIEANYERCKVSIRDIKWNSPEIRGLYKPQPPLAAL